MQMNGVGAVMPRHGDWQLEAAGIGGDGVGVSTDAARDASGARGHLSSGE